MRARGMLGVVMVALAGALCAALSSMALASGGADVRMEPAQVNRLDLASAQRGARIFVNYCLNCHTAKYMRYNRLTDLGLTDAQIRDNLLFAGDKTGDTMTVAMRPADAKAWFGVPPPDLSVEARVRGAQWLYNYFLAFYKDDHAPSGWNNLLFPNVAMPHVLQHLGGTNQLVTREFKTHEEAQAAVADVDGLHRDRGIADRDGRLLAYRGAGERPAVRGTGLFIGHALPRQVAPEATPGAQSRTPWQAAGS